jgi:hypothetical protein
MESLWSLSQEVKIKDSTINSSAAKRPVCKVILFRLVNLITSLSKKAIIGANLVFFFKTP